MKRRQLLKATGATIVGSAIAGCSGQGNGQSNTGNGGGAQSDGQSTTIGNDRVTQGRTDSWFNIDGEIASDSVDQLKFTRVDLAQVAGGDGGTQSGSTGTQSSAETQTSASAGTPSGGSDNQSNDGIFGGGNAAAAVNGVLKNTADQPYQNVEVTATLYDQNDPIGQFFDSTEDRNKDYLRPGNKWQFTILFKGSDIDKATRYTVQADGTPANRGGNGTTNRSSATSSGTTTGTATDTFGN